MIMQAFEEDMFEKEGKTEGETPEQPENEQDREEEIFGSGGFLWTAIQGTMSNVGVLKACVLALAIVVVCMIALLIVCLYGVSHLDNEVSALQAIVSEYNITEEPAVDVNAPPVSETNVNVDEPITNERQVIVTEEDISSEDEDVPPAVPNPPLHN